MPEKIGVLTDKWTFCDAAGECAIQDAQVRIVMKQEILSVFLMAVTTPVREVVLCWDEAVSQNDIFLGDHWERAYGDLEWKKPEAVSFMPWYFLKETEDACYAYGVRVRPKAMCHWEIGKGQIRLHLDVRCGSQGVILKGREIEAAQVLMKRYEVPDSFGAAVDFCKCMCTDSLYVGVPVYGNNNWYYAYGKSSGEEIIKDAAGLAELTEGIENRPFMVIDDGWQMCHTEEYNGGPWREGNQDYGDMGRLAEKIKQLNVRPGIWFRPLLDNSEQIPESWRLGRERTVLDISVPEAVAHVQEDIRRITGWGYELIKHDFSTWDLLGRWGFEMGSSLTDEGWQFKDSSRTTAEIITGFYAAILEAAGNALILGCNCIGHLGAGLMHLNRTGDDTSGVEWERTRKMGINALAFRMPQQGTFFGADADCAGITEKIDWEKNRQWVELLSVSGTPFFVSVKPDSVNKVQKQILMEAYRKAAVNTIPAVPLCWQKSKTPEKWQTFEGEKNFCW